MSITKFTKLTSAVFAAVLTSYSSANATTIAIYTAANFNGTLSALISKYQATIDATAAFTVTSGATATLESNIISLGNTGTGQADLFFSADASHAEAVENYNSPNHTLVVPYTSSPLQYSWRYAQGYLVLWSNNGTNVSGGLPNPFNANFVIADPTTAPYGTAAQQLMSGSPWYYSSTIPGGYVHTASTIGTTFTAVQNGTYAYGFVAASQVCTYDPNTSTKTYTNGGSNGAYPYNSGYSDIIQKAVKINRTTRTTAESNLLDDFVSFLSSTDAQNIILSYCYTIPTP
ncbi:substrate-binding domain-containing protein [Methylosinus sp. LW4]|uniref:substrate-binding domain-containing protein n=1 Tax=Methylosinus sp. LW4 TaxID=136993 RepID=UPI0012FBFE63|nr:substrate-binding domain-containing protein [Methylosinus sp. LW4]